jgi:general secretion pathway protein J
VALAIFGVLTVLAYQALGQTFANAELLGERMARIQSIQQTMRLLGRDLAQAAPRPVRDLLNEGHVPSMRTDLSSDFLLEVTRGGWPNPAGLPRGTLQRVAYRLEEEGLVRYHWPVLDPTLTDEPIGTVILEDVESLLLRYGTAGGEWLEQWPPPNTGGPTAWRIRPRVVEVVLTLADQGEIRRFFEVAP